MSEENVEVVRATVQAINRRDLDSAFKHATPDCEFDLSRAVGLRRSIYNVEQWRAVSEEFWGMWESARWDVGEYIDAGDHVVTPITNRLRGRDGIEVEARVTWLWTFRDGAVKRATLYQERKEALEAAGLSE
jgi:ketosteroid isomerase-like protein